MKLHKFNHIAGVPVHYSRHTHAMYGTRGRGPRWVRLEEKFHDLLVDCFLELWDMCGMGPPEVFCTGGCYVEKAGRHGEGTAVDIDSFHWKDRDFVTLNYPDDARFYIAIEAILRRHFGTVLQYEYNRAHRCHWHVDSGSPVGFYPKSRSRTLFVQSALTHIYERPVTIDGIYGPHTQANVKDALWAMKNSFSIKHNGTLSSVWQEFLAMTAVLGFMGG